MPAPGNIGDSAEGLIADLSDRYEVVREHARGGMSTVYLAVDRKHDRQVALKVLAPELAAGVGSERFLREIQIAAHLNHPHILPLLDSGIAAGLPYYVMPFVEEESLRTRLKREGPLPLDTALRIAVDVGEALAYAHGRGVIHRDIKPGNILLAEGSAIVTDFGIAAAIEQAPDEHLTRTGLSVGSVGYMSPEQASGDDCVDGRADQYSLACVLFEMLVGRLPFEGTSARAVLGRQVSQPVPSISDTRSSVPSRIDLAIRRALSPAPDDRYPTVSQFASALDGTAPFSVLDGARVRLGSRLASLPLRGLGVALAVTLTIATTAWLLPELAGRTGEEMVELDSLRYAIFPFEKSDGAELELNEEQFLRSALGRWRGISIVEGAQLQDAMRRTGREHLDRPAATQLAREQGAGRFIVGEIGRAGESLQLETRLLDGDAKQLAVARAAILPETGQLDSIFTRLVDELLFRGAAPTDAPATGESASYPALQAFQHGTTAVQAWDLTLADSFFARATREDPEFGRAHLWLALSRAWSDRDPATWQIPASQADLHRAGMSDRDAAIGQAILSQALGDFGEACSRWRELTVAQPRDYAGWYGLAMCLANDKLVVPDESSPSGWSFRASRQEALEAFKRAFRLLPAILGSFHSNSFESLRRLFSLSGNVTRAGVSASPDSLMFRAFPAWMTDSVGYIPYPREVSNYDQIALNAAVAEMRLVFVDIARSWVADAPGSARALAALAVGEAMLGNSDAIQTIERARTLGSTDGGSLDIISTEIWLRLAFGFPSDTESLTRVRRLADSLLSLGPSHLGDARLGAGLASLVGRGSVGAVYARRRPGDPGSPLPPSQQADARALAMFSSLGGPTDSILRLERLVDDAIDRLSPPVGSGERAWRLGLPATMSFPEQEFATASELSDDWMVAAQLALRSGDTVFVRKALKTQAELRRGLSVEYLSMDSLYPEAHLLYSVGEYDEAARWLDPTLRELPRMDLSMLSTPARVAGLVRAAALRAQIASSLGQPEEAARWARSVLLLWSDSDSAVDATVARMRDLVD